MATTTGAPIDLTALAGVSSAQVQPTTSVNFMDAASQILGLPPATPTAPGAATPTGSPVSDGAVRVTSQFPPTLTTVGGTTTAGGAAAVGAAPAAPNGVVTISLQDQIQALDRKLDERFDALMKHISGSPVSAAIAGAAAAAATTTAGVPSVPAPVAPAAPTPTVAGQQLPTVGLAQGVSWDSIFPKQGGRRSRRGQTARRRRGTRNRRSRTKKNVSQ